MPFTSYQSRIYIKVVLWFFANCSEGLGPHLAEWSLTRLSVSYLQICLREKAIKVYEVIVMTEVIMIHERTNDSCANRTYFNINPMSTD